jgi:Family of unknown function (DUF6152)
MVPGSAAAHHSGSMYDDKKTITVVGTVKKYEWSNPHVYIYIEQKNDAGQLVEWEVECSPPSILGRLGWSAASFHPGDAITVTGSPARDASKHAVLPSLVKRGETTLFERKVELAQLAKIDAAPGGAVKATSLEGVWATQLSLPLEKALDGENMALTPAGKAAFKHFDEKTMHPGTECIATPAPFLMVTPDLKRITRMGGMLFIDGEFDNAQRTIHLDMSSHEGAAASIQGHSIGRWEGNSLLIDTVLFAPHVIGNGYGVPSSAAKHMTERLTLNASGTALMYHFEVTDPKFLSRPLQGDIQWEYRPSLAYAPPQCDPENARRSFRAH